MSQNINVDDILSGNKRTLAKAITLVESSLESHQQQAQALLEKVMPQTGKSIRIGISGSPGVGKSTFIESLGLYLTSKGKKTAVLAVDPSSPVSGGSILGDKTRMELLSREEQAFIRPSPSSGSLGGVAKKTRETMLLCEAAGYEVILVETVGVGQSEYEVHSMVDFFLVLMLPNAGDELQGIKKGIIELADAIVVNKADGDSLGLARQTVSQYQSAFHILDSKAEGHPKSFWQPEVRSCSSLEHNGIPEVWEMIDRFSEGLEEKEELRNLQNKMWTEKLISDLLERRIQSSPETKQVHDEQIENVLRGKTTPQLAAQAVIEKLFS